MKACFELHEGNHPMLSPLALMIRFPIAIFTCSADGELTLMDKHLFLADRDRNVFVMGDVQYPDGVNLSISPAIIERVLCLD